MITSSILFILLYSYSVYKIKKDSGSWKLFNPLYSNMFAYMMFMLGTIAIIFVTLLILFFLAKYDIIP